MLAMRLETIEDWCALPELIVPVTTSPYQTGLVVKVLKVGLLYATRAECERVGLKSVAELRDLPEGPPAIALPVATIEVDGAPKVFRLPQGFGDWAFTVVALAHQGTNVFPSLTEFGELNGKHVADVK